MNRWNALRELALITWVSGCVLTAAHADVVKLGDVVEPKDCGNGFDYVPATKSCKAIDATIATFDENQCQGAALNWDKDSKKCSANAKAPPKPQCGDKIPDLTLKDGECVVERKVPSSSPGDYVGDCLRITASPTSDILNFVPSRYLKVQSQGIRNGDKVLRVVPAKADALFGKDWFGCSALEAPYREVSARALEDAGLQRAGWAYGMLTMPFKYHIGGGLTSSGSIGPYIGWRLDFPGMAKTVAVAATIGSVRGEVRDPKDNTKIIGTPELVAYSVAGGMMFDVTKAPGGKPFKVGAFIGQDRVSSDDAAKYKYNRKTWLAFQIGFEFTDN